MLGQTDLLGQVALHHAAMGGQEGTLAVLLGLQPAGDLPRNAEGASAVQMAAAAGSEACVSMLLQYEQQQQQNRVLPLAHGAQAATRVEHSVGCADRTGFTPLHAAAYRGHAAVCLLLLEWGADAGAICSQSAHASHADANHNERDA